MLREVKYFSKVTQLLSVVSTRICTWIAWLLCTISFLISMLKPHATFIITLSSVNQISRSVVPNSLQPHGLQHARPPCPSPTPGVYSNSCPLSQWCHPTISSSVVPFLCHQSFSASGSFQMSQFFTSSGQSIGASASVLILPINIQDWPPLVLTGLISLLSKKLKSFCHHPSLKASDLWCSAFFMVQLSHPYVSNGKIIALTM